MDWLREPDVCAQAEIVEMARARGWRIKNTRTGLEGEV